MKAIKGDHPQSGVEEKIDSGLTAKKPRPVLSRGDSRYWTEPGRLFKNHGAADYSCRFTTGGRREHFNLGTANAKSAAAKAAEVFRFIQAHGWDAALARYKPKATPKAGGVTVGDLIAAACRVSTARRQSLIAYTGAFRLIVSEIRGLGTGRKHDTRGGGAAEWRERVDMVPLSKITPAAVTGWRNKRMREAETDPLAKRRAIVTTNALIRNARALFAKRLLPFIEQSMPLPRPLPFDGVTLEKAPSARYHSRIDPHAILTAARAQLAETDPEAFKVLVLALVCGLRRGEIDALLWRAVDFANGVLRVESTEFHQLKSEDSAGEIDLDPETLALFRGWRARRPKTVFVVESPNGPRTSSKSRRYRCDGAFKRLLGWLHKNGVADPRPVHVLRKEVGSLIAAEHGIYAASRYLRHSSIAITAAVYLDRKQRVTPKTFAGLLADAGGNAPIPIRPDQDATTARASNQ